MARRWTAAGVPVAEEGFRRIKYHKDMSLLVAALARHATYRELETVRAAAYMISDRHSSPTAVGTSPAPAAASLLER